MLEILVQILVTLQFFLRIALSFNITKIFLWVFLAISGFSKRFNMILIHSHSFFFRDYMLRLHPWISPSSYFTSPSRVYSSSKQFTNCCAISRTVLPRGESSSNVNPSRFFFGMHRPVFVLVTCTLKWSLFLLCSWIIYYGFCFSFDHILIIFLKTDHSWLYCSYSLAKYNSWTCALLDISTRYSPIISSNFLLVFWYMTSSIEF